MNDINWLEKTKESYNDYYKTYRADWCRKSGLPMMDSSCWEKIQAEDLYTVSRAKKKHVSIDMKKVCGWYRIWHRQTCDAADQFTGDQGCTSVPDDENPRRR